MSDFLAFWIVGAALCYWSCETGLNSMPSSSQFRRWFMRRAAFMCAIAWPVIFAAIIIASTSPRGDA